MCSKKRWGALPKPSSYRVGDASVYVHTLFSRVQAHSEQIYDGQYNAQEMLDTFRQSVQLHLEQFFALSLPGSLCEPAQPADKAALRARRRSRDTIKETPCTRLWPFSPPRRLRNTRRCSLAALGYLGSSCIS